MNIFGPTVVSAKTCMFIIDMKENGIGCAKLIFIGGIVILSDAEWMNIKMEVTCRGNFYLAIIRGYI